MCATHHSSHWIAPSAAQDHEFKSNAQPAACLPACQQPSADAGSSASRSTVPHGPASFSPS
ncbi:hypothetical protein TIFTF001_003201 [Ficus carica]|uniref:Uncharacterized protein n=1 Tax=Ficus carica TaxID=3494 RepID=A0AA87ZYB7_FICCA|nr:hypothetical protein TIFTF001_003201 [Ficus carica]